MSKDFVERRDESFYVAGSRVPLAHLVREFQLGESPEAVRSHYPALSLEQVYGAITFYLGNQEEVEADIAAREREEDSFTATHPTPPAVSDAFERMRQQTPSRRS
jgi:hypothetical protein